jgi:hypothetical protein
MKSRHLPETDIANLAFLPVMQKQSILLNWLKPKVITRSYEPFRDTVGDAVNRQLPLFPEGQVPTPWAKLEELVTKKCRGDAVLLEMNLTIARATYELSLAHQMSAEPVDVRPLTLSQGHAYHFGMPVILRYDDGASVAFTDLRRKGRLTAHGCRIAHSVLHQRFRVNFPEYDQLRLEIWRYLDTDARQVEIIRHSSEQLVPYEQLVADFAETYQLLNALIEEQIAARRKSGDGRIGPLFG